MASKSPPQPLRLANLFAKVPHIADLVVRELEPSDVEDLLMNTDPALSSFCNGSGGGIDHFIDISTRAHQERKRLRKLPSLPRLLEEEWRKRLVGKKMIAEHLQSDEMVGNSFLFCCMKAIS